MARVCKAWTKEEELELSEIFKEKTDEELSEIFGTTVIGIKHKRRRLKLSRETWNDERDNRLKQIYHMYTDKELAEIFETTDVAVSSRRWKFRLLREDESNEDVPEGHKKCIGCGLIFPLEYFNKNKKNKDGKDGYCKDCVSEKNFARKAKFKEELASLEQRKQEKIDEYAEKFKGEKLYCKKCDEEKTIEDYYLYASVQENGNICVLRQCKICRSNRVKSKKLKDAIIKGY